MKKSWVWLIIIILLIMAAIFFYPKSCGGTGKLDGCTCIGIMGDQKLIKTDEGLEKNIGSSCYGLCLKSTCKTTVILNGIDYGCKNNNDCVSQCLRGCININWAKSNPDNSECFRLFDCSCNNNVCYTDGMPPR